MSIASFSYSACYRLISFIERVQKVSIKIDRFVIFFSFRIFLAITYCLSPYLYDTNFSEPINVEIRFVLRFVSLNYSSIFIRIRSSS